MANYSFSLLHFRIYFHNTHTSNFTFVDTPFTEGSRNWYYFEIVVFLIHLESKFVYLILKSVQTFRKFSLNNK